MPCPSVSAELEPLNNDDQVHKDLPSLPIKALARGKVRMIRDANDTDAGNNTEITPQGRVESTTEEPMNGAV
ncbi:hypothetical protein AAVH_12622 [Aphelenchoides avenae]|nr:hypothetical protein AAVH_12622 [Aphelenchus avenae]